jgi:hypothetical protein
MQREYDIGEILGSGVKDFGGDISVTFKKVIQVRPYEPETLEVEVVLKADGLNPEERMLAAILAQAKAEYQVFSSGYIRGLISLEELKNRTKSIEINVNKFIEIFGDKVKNVHVGSNG